MLVRPMAAADALAVASLSEQLGYPIPPTVTAERLAMLSQSGGHGCYVAERDGTIIGWVQVYGVHLLASA